eukprot:CAMPEP_0172862996 /NCGR_PEP_ID=MMETSP1075-20121228/75956_1 /TAXON_ID=2916 /ORGANISM="Ceratium fusus, Strain PA161109" /LENGTH=81 /DNA_ID=CAMNT_0013711471 /DNA_START=21 /DNA_END=262 /DNA_ORIENTATION=-
MTTVSMKRNEPALKRKVYCIFFCRAFLRARAFAWASRMKSSSVIWAGAVCAASATVPASPLVAEASSAPSGIERIWRLQET